MSAGEVPLMLPEKLATGKYLMELEPAKDGADDLTGDAGAVGRMLVSGEQVRLALSSPGPGCSCFQVMAVQCQQGLCVPLTGRAVVYTSALLRL